MIALDNKSTREKIDAVHTLLQLSREFRSNFIDKFNRDMIQLGACFIVADQLPDNGNCADLVFEKLGLRLYQSSLFKKGESFKGNIVYKDARGRYTVL